MTTQKRKFSSKELEKIAIEECDYVRFFWLINPASGKLTRQDREWLSAKSIRYLAELLAVEDCYDNHTNNGVRQGRHSIDWWESWLRTLNEEEVNNELCRFNAKLETEIRPWLDDQKRGV